MHNSLKTDEKHYNSRNLRKYRERTISLLKSEGITLVKNYSLTSVNELSPTFQMNLKARSLTTQSANQQIAQYLALIQKEYPLAALTFMGQPADGVMKLDFCAQYESDQTVAEEALNVEQDSLPQDEIETTSKKEELDSLQVTQGEKSGVLRFSSQELLKQRALKEQKPPRNIKTRELLPLTDEMLNATINGKTLREILNLCERVSISEDGRFDLYLATPEVLKLYFNWFNENRDIIEPHIESIEDSYETHDYLYTEARVNELLQVVDAQHRVETAIRNNLNMYFRIMVGWGMEEVIASNLNNKNWTAMNFLRSYAKKGIPAYVLFEKFYDKHDFDLSTCEILFKGHRINKGKKASDNDFNNKRLTISAHELEQAEIRASAMTDFKEYHPKGWTSRNFAEIIHFLLCSPKYNHEEMLRKMSKMKKTANILFAAKGPLRVEEYARFLVNEFNKNKDESDLIPIPPRYMQQL